MTPGMVPLIVGTVFSVLFVILLLAGSRYQYMIDPLDGDAFPLKFLYAAGFTLEAAKPFRLRGRLWGKLRDEATLYYGKRFGEFYAHAVWAQTLTFAILCPALMLTLAGIMGELMPLFVLLGVLLPVLAAYYFLTYTAGKLKSRREECELELPNAISKLALLVNSGATMHEAWKMTAFGKEGGFYDLMQRACTDMDNGRSEIDAIYYFGLLTGSPEVKKFTSALIQSIERGGGELSMFLANQSSELWSMKRQRLLQKGEKAASTLLVPIALMFAGIMLIVMASAMQSFSF